MNNAQLIEEFEDARADRARLEQMHDDVDRFGLCDRLLEVIGTKLIKAQVYVRELHCEIEYRLNWEPRSRAWGRQL